MRWATIVLRDLTSVGVVGAALQEVTQELLCALSLS